MQKLFSSINVKAIVRIYDAQGKLIATPINKNISNPLGEIPVGWPRLYDARVPIGLYYCHLEIIERSTGHKRNCATHCSKIYNEKARGEMKMKNAILLLF